MYFEPFVRSRTRQRLAVSRKRAMTSFSRSRRLALIHSRIWKMFANRANRKSNASDPLSDATATAVRSRQRSTRCPLKTQIRAPRSADSLHEGRGSDLYSPHFTLFLRTRRGGGTEWGLHLGAHRPRTVLRSADRSSTPAVTIRSLSVGRGAPACPG